MGNITEAFLKQEPDASSNVKCDVDQTYYPHLLLVPAGMIIIILAFLQQRRTFKKEVCGGRPGVVVPMDFLGMDRDRLAIMCVFGAAAGSIFTLVFRLRSGNKDPWKKAFPIIGTCIECAFLYYPYFGCLASYHRIIGALMGLSYAVVVFIVYMVTAVQKCNNPGLEFFVIMVVISEIPSILCHMFIVGKFVLVLYKEIKEYGMCKMQFFFRKDKQSVEIKLVRQWLNDYVKSLFNPKPARQYSRIELYLRKIYNPAKNFQFSTQTLSVVMVCFILLYAISLSLLYLVSLKLVSVNKAHDDRSTDLVLKTWRATLGSLIGATICAAVLCVISLVRFMENHKNNMLRMFKGDKSFIPKCIGVSQFMVGKALRFHSFQVCFFLWGYALLLLLFFVIFFGFYVVKSCPWIRAWVSSLLEEGGVFLGVSLLTHLILLITAVTVFRDHDYPRDVISINNRNVYLVFSYFWFFLGLPMGIFSAMFRILKAMVVGAFMLPRIDRSVLPGGFQRIDRGFNAYICYLHVQTAVRNPILRVFCQKLVDETGNKNKNWTCSAQARARWFLALTLARNPQLASERKSVIQAYTQPVQVVYVNHGDVKLEVGPYKVLQDK